jgi:hypothetical protein
VLSLSPPRAPSFLVGALAHQLGIPDPLRIFAIPVKERLVRKLTDFGRLIIGFLNRKNVCRATVYFASCLAFQWSLSEPGLLMLKGEVQPDAFKDLIEQFRPTKPGLSRPDSAVSIFLLATLLNLWKRFTGDVEYIQRIFLIIPNLILPLLGGETFPYDELSYLSALESVGLEFVQTISEVQLPGLCFDLTFRDPSFTRLIVRMRAEREAASRRRTGELERLYTAEMQALEDVSERMANMRREIDSAERAGAGLAGQLGRQREQAMTVAQRMRTDVEARDRRLAELQSAKANADGRQEELEERLRAQIAFVKDRDAQLARLAEEDRASSARIAELETELACAEEEFVRQGIADAGRWCKAADRLLARPDEDVDVAAILSVPE